jgi:hypothetical protein
MTGVVSPSGAITVDGNFTAKEGATARTGDGLTAVQDLIAKAYKLAPDATNEGLAKVLDEMFGAADRATWNAKQKEAMSMLQKVASEFQTMSDKPSELETAFTAAGDEKFATK